MKQTIDECFNCPTCEWRTAELGPISRMIRDMTGDLVSGLMCENGTQVQLMKLSNVSPIEWVEKYGRDFRLLWMSGVRDIEELHHELYRL